MGDSMEGLARLRSLGFYAMGILPLAFFTGACAEVQEASIECANNFDCDATEYCAADACGGPGTCLTRPTDCSPNVSFVCGCDAVTYDNACAASKAGARIAAEGECVCETSDDCNPEDYCEGESCAGAGTCEPKPTDCPVVFDPVCGCDGATYDSECIAESLGVRIESPGPCPCTDNSECPEAEYCAGETCASEGACEARPGVCPLVLDPVCGCDGATYNNFCDAAASGVRVDFDGECP